MQGDGAGLEASGIEDVIDEARHPLGRVPDRAHVALRAARLIVGRERLFEQRREERRGRGTSRALAQRAKPGDDWGMFGAVGRVFFEHGIWFFWVWVLLI